MRPGKKRTKQNQKNKLNRNETWMANRRRRKERQDENRDRVNNKSICKLDAFNIHPLIIIITGCRLAKPSVLPRSNPSSKVFLFFFFFLTLYSLSICVVRLFAPPSFSHASSHIHISLSRTHSSSVWFFFFLFWVWIIVKCVCAIKIANEKWNVTKKKCHA